MACNFVQKNFVNLWESNNCNIKYTANQHARANPTERQNGTLKTMIYENNWTWYQELPNIACALRTARQEATKLTPYFINFHRNRILSREDYDNNELLGEESGKQTAEISRNASFKEMLANVKKRLEQAAQKYCNRYNLRRRYGYEEFVPK